MKTERAACQIAAHLNNLFGRRETLLRTAVPLFTNRSVVESWLRERGRIDKALDGGLPRTAERRLDRLATLSRRLSRSLLCDLDSLCRETPDADPREIARELRQLKREFGSWSWSNDYKSLKVRTEAIVLDDLPLGQFDLSLRLVESPFFEADGCEPNPAACNPDIQHPHVSACGLVCLGDAEAAFRLACGQRRLADAFLIADGVLKTYNDGSPYVSLGDWSCLGCTDCGRTIRNGSGSVCLRCEKVFCDGCTSWCEGCVDWICSECGSSCGGCGRHACAGHLTTCPDCGRRACAACLEDNRCGACREEASHAAAG